MSASPKIRIVPSIPIAFLIASSTDITFPSYSGSVDITEQVEIFLLLLIFKAITCPSFSLLGISRNNFQLKSLKCYNSSVNLFLVLSFERKVKYRSCLSFITNFFIKICSAGTIMCQLI